MITSDRCHNYGIVHGCDEHCPALLDGGCDNFDAAIECCELSINRKAALRQLHIRTGKLNESRTTYNTFDT